MKQSFDICAPPSGIHHGNGYVWPTPTQQWMLRAALMPNTAGRESWEKWIASVDIDHLDAGSFRMIPLLYRNLKRIGVESPLLGRFKGIYRRAWYENQVAMHKLSGLLREFHEIGIRTLILKGAALALLYYRDLGLRPMSDLDVLVPANKAIDAMGLLRKTGWKPEKDLLERVTQDYLLAAKACNLARNESDIKLDLHWHVFQECLEPDSDVDLWERSLPVACSDVATLALSPADQLLHICAHAMEWNAIAPMRWVADAFTVISTTPDLDWSSVLAQARQRRLVLTLQYMLPYLRHLVDVPVPENVERELHRLPVEQVEHDWIKIRTRGVADLKISDLFRVRYGLYRRSALSSRYKPMFLGFPRYMQLIWGIAHWWQLPLRFLRTTRGIRSS